MYKVVGFVGLAQIGVFQLNRSLGSPITGCGWMSCASFVFLLMQDACPPWYSLNTISLLVRSGCTQKPSPQPTLIQSPLSIPFTLCDAVIHEPLSCKPQ